MDRASQAGHWAIVDVRARAVRFARQLSSIELLLCDVDGVLTDGRILWMGDDIGWNRFFHTADGYGMKLLLAAGVDVGIVSAEDSQGLRRRFERVGVTRLYVGSEDKRGAWHRAQADTGLADEAIAYIGDELFDLPLLRRAGFSATVPHASPEVREAVDYVTARPGGHGAVREVIDMIRIARGLEPDIPGF